MTGPTSGSKKWIEVGRSQSTLTENKNRAQVQLDDYYVVIGFEVNKPDAFKDKVHDLSVDYGHAFYYIVKNKSISMVFSFGPDGDGKNGWLNRGQNKYIPAPLKNGINNSRPGTPDYIISEPVKAFRIKISTKQGVALEAITKEAREDVKTGKIQYSAFLNDTCAETARELLADADIDNPSGSGTVKHSRVMPVSVPWVTNPYMWHHNFVKSGSVEKIFTPPPERTWRPTIGQSDPIFGDVN
jgi:hypothetical protein